MTQRTKSAAWLALVLGLSPSLVAAQPATTSDPPAAAPTSDPPQDPAQEDTPAARAARFESSLRYQTGEVAVGAGLARIDLGGDFRYLDPAQTGRVLEAWGNPAGATTLGLVVPTGVPVMSDEAWAVVLTSSNDGHVNDDDADDLNFDEILEEMKRDSRTQSERRVQMGLSPLTLVGWAERPRYDRATHILYWAKDLDSGRGPHTLNYAMRVLGRTQVLELNAVAAMGQLSMVRGRMEGLRQRVRFEQGRRYTDFVPSADRVAAYGIGALVAGKVIAKTGLLKGLLALLIAGKKLVAAAVVAAAAGLRSLFSRRSNDAPPPADP